MLFIFEMANNHQGCIKHGKKIIDVYSNLSKKYKIRSAIKLQFRQLSTFIHEDFKKTDTKHVKRFEETALTKNNFKELISYIKEKGLQTAATPFDSESLNMINDLNVDIVKVASCSIDDWPLLNDIVLLNKKTIISTGGASLDVIRKVYDLFKKNNIDFSFLHCVSEYPTPIENANLNRINILKNEFPDITIGHSTHESPTEKSLVPYAIAMGAKIIEKHVGIETNKWKLNKYSCNPSQIETLFKEIKNLKTSFNNEKFNKKEKECLDSLKRGIYVNKKISKGQKITKEDIYFAIPLQKNQLDASSFEKIIGKKILKTTFKNEKLTINSFEKKSNVNYKKIKIKDPADRFDLSYAFANNFSTLGISNDPLVEMVNEAKKYNARSALVHPADIENLVCLLKGSNVRPEVLIDFPDGLGGVITKTNQAIFARNLGAVGADLVVNMHAVQNRDKKTLEAEFKAVTKYIKDVKAIIQIPYLWKYDKSAIKWVIKIASNCGIYCIKDWTTRENFLLPPGEKLDFSDKTRLEYIEYMNNFITENNIPVILKIAGRVNENNAKLFVKKGADLIGLSYRKTKLLREALLK